MNYNIVDTELIKVSEDVKLQVLTVGEETKHTVIVIDNFLQNPEDLLSIIETHPIEMEWGKWGHPTHLKLMFIRKMFNYLASEYYGVTDIVDLEDKLRLQFNIVNGGMPCNYTTIIPHIDPAMLAFSLFLNKDCEGGTGFYKHKKSGIDYQVEYFDEGFKKTEKYWQIHETYRKAKKHDYETILDSRNIHEDDWELQYVVDAQYNRFVMHPSYIFHSAYVEKEWYQEEKRVSLAGFIL